MRQIPGKIEKHKLAVGIFLIQFKTQYELASTFLRFQEHYESPKFSRKIFSIEEFMDWYAEENGNKFSYFTDWSGFNVPSTVFQPFYEGKFDPLLEKEKRLLELVKNLGDRFYVIGLFDPHDLTHELAHALYFMDPTYEQSANKAMKNFDTSAFKAEKLAGYAKHVIRDEIQAHLVAPGRLEKQFQALRPLQRELRVLFHDHSNTAGIRIPS
jgi:hypothetical protein